MYGIFTYIWLILMVNVGKYTIHGWYGYLDLYICICFLVVHLGTNIDVFRTNKRGDSPSNLGEKDGAKGSFMTNSLRISGNGMQQKKE